MVFVPLKVMPALDLDAVTCDITEDYLNAPRRHPESLFMLLVPALTTLWLTLHPDHRQYVYRGSLYLRVNKAIYGLRDACFDFYICMASFLLSSGFIRSDSDPCLFIRFDSWSNLIFIATWVDDLFVVGKGPSFSSFADVLRSKFRDITHSSGDFIQFLGRTCKCIRLRRSVSISQVEYIHDLLADYEFSNCKPVSDPFGTSFLDNYVDSPACDLLVYLSLCMSFMYLAFLAPTFSSP